ncbi:phage head closure protein [Edaphosphingomonas haloaromaticamans]|uniref:Phage head-tail joining protein n=1 Tax=Edaphosphingomonas haloaromaticamans TaxID=653954 RepID=A0A1S1HHA7_9SPHN|nr:MULTISPECIES: phage head closure protein [Sphingomonas]MDX3884032.1 phage head closure protein [Sphingomonas sp.]OHT19910.1 Phage head-tail joining protein [Sphingomonas haloaromaticamans]
MARLAAGRLRHRVSIHRLEDSDDGRGGYVRSWHEIATVWAEVIGQGGREALIDRSMQGIGQYRVTIRWRDDIRTNDQVRYRGRNLNIRSIEPDATDRVWLSMMCDTDAEAIG